MWSTLISAPEVLAHLDTATWVVVDCRFDLKDPGWGERVYREGHIPGAGYAHLDRQLSGPKTGQNGRHPLPAPNEAAATFGALGISHDTQVVAYDQDNGMYASRLWWMLRWLGHDAVAVLDGGLAAWLGAGYAVTATLAPRAHATFQARVRSETVVTLAQVPQRLAQGWALVDGRAPERFRGDVEPLDRVPGHIPGARNHYFQRNVRADGTWRSARELHTLYEATLAGAAPARTICYCGSGVTACHNVLAMAHAGLKGAVLYAGSWSEWSSDPSRDVATGDA